MSSVILIWPFVKKRWKTMAVGAIFVILTNLLQVVIPSIIGRAIDLLRESFVMKDVLLICGLLLVLEVIKGLFKFLMRYLIIGVSWKIENDIRLRIYGHLLKLPRSYYDTSRTGDIIARVTNDLTAVRAMIGPAVMYTVNACVLLPAALTFMLMKDIEITLYSVIPFPFIALMIYILGKKIHRYFKKVQESYSDISAHVQENLNGIRVIKAYVLEQFERATLRNLSKTYVENNRKVIQVQSFFYPLLDVLASTGVIIVLWVGGKKVAAGEMTLGTLVAFIMYIGMLVWPSIALGWVIAVFQRGSASVRRIFDILDIEPERQDDGGDMEPLQGAMTVRGLNFSYNGEEQTLKDISFTVKPGGTLGIVGRTGSGKSTLLDVLSGSYDVPVGVISYDGVDINDLPLSRIRNSIALVPQETFLFSESVAENIAFGKDDAGEESIRRAAQLAAVDGEIDSFPDGFETMLGERGITVSGGQRQRIAIARALISDAKILFFDDCLSNVDTVTEMEILKNIKNVIQNKTAIIVTQRLRSITDADEILYLKNGSVLEHGTHNELMKLDGEYAALYNEQESIEKIEETEYHE